MISGTFVHAIQKQHQANLPFRERYKATPKGAGIAARDLKPNEARDLVVFLHLHGYLTLEKQPEFDEKGKLTYPTPGQLVRIKPAEFYGVQYVSADRGDPQRGLTKPIDQRLAVLLVRLGLWLRKEWGPITPQGAVPTAWRGLIYCKGLGLGRDREESRGGTVLDIYGVQTRYGEFNVWRDWGVKPVSDLIGGDRFGSWPVSTTNTSFRFAEIYAGVSDWIDPKNLPANFFHELYKFLTTQAQHDGRNRTTAKIGEPSLILHPDTANAHQRIEHRFKIHVEVGGRSR